MSGTDLQSLGDAKLEALVEVMFLAAFADGEFSDVEREHFVKSVESLTDGREARLASVKARLPDAGSRKVALSLVIQVTAADGIIRTSERELILETAEALEIDRDEAANLVSKLSR